jgi:hypothetical protein
MMKKWIAGIVVVSFGLVGNVSAVFKDFNNAGGNGQWGTLTNWLQGVFPTSADSDRILKNCHVANGVTAFGGSVAVAGFDSDAALYVDAGGTLSVGSSGISVAYSRKTALLDISGTLTSSGVVSMGTDATKAPTATINFNSGCSATLAGLSMGSTTNAGVYTVNQTGGNVTMSGDIKIGDVSDALCNAAFTISDGTLKAVRLNTGGNGTSTAKFTVNGSEAGIQFTGQSWLDGKTELKFIFDTAGVSALMMTNGGYTAASTVSLIVDATAFTGSIGSGIKLIGVDDVNDTLTHFATNKASITSGYALDYRSGDGVYVTAIPEPGTVALFILSGVGLFVFRRYVR